jgi:hypothetical protein
MVGQQPLARELMRILSIDAATRMGWCFGCSSDQSPVRYKALRLRDPDQSIETAAYNVGPWLRDRLREFHPDALVVEEKMSLAGQKSAQAGAAQHLLHGGILSVAGQFGIRVYNPNVGTVRKFMCGKRSAAIKATRLRSIAHGPSKWC